MKKWIIQNVLVIQVFTLLFTSGCATTGKSIGVGAAAGGLLGAGAGAIADPGKQGQNRFRNVVIGTAVGSAVGAGAGYLIGKTMESDRQDAFEKGKKEEAKEAESHAAEASGSPPVLLPARTEARWVADQVRGGTFVPGHFEYLIIEAAHWSTGSR